MTQHAQLYRLLVLRKFLVHFICVAYYFDLKLLIHVCLDANMAWMLIQLALYSHRNQYNCFMGLQKASFHCWNQYFNFCLANSQLFWIYTNLSWLISNGTAQSLLCIRSFLHIKWFQTAVLYGNIKAFGKSEVNKNNNAIYFKKTNIQKRQRNIKTKFWLQDIIQAY